MRQWNINPKKMCNQHLLGEHLEMHMFVGCINKGTSLKGYIDEGLVEIHNIRSRHDELVKEMISRGMNHNSQIDNFEWERKGRVNVEENEIVLKNRCLKCKKLMEEFRDG